MDSATALALAVRASLRVHAVSFRYGQRHRRELEFAEKLTNFYQVPHLIVDLPPLGASALTSPGAEIPEGHYAAESMRATVVPNRNMIFLAVAAGIALDRGLNRLYCGVHAGDHAIYPDCRPEFVDFMKLAIRAASEGKVELDAPFVLCTKAEIVSNGIALQVPFHLTYSCYKGGERHCGKCGTCTERREAFRDAGFPDPTEYEQ